VDRKGRPPIRPEVPVPLHPDLLVFNHPFDFQKGPQLVKMRQQEIVGVLRRLVVRFGAFGVDLQRTSRELGC
jgi:hypothetical protein